MTSWFYALVFSAIANVITSPDNHTIDEMNTFVALCVGAGTPRPTISWAQNGNQLESSSRTTITEEVTETDSGITFIQSFLKICSVDPVDAGLYHCIVANRFENDSAYFTLNVTRVGGEWALCMGKSATNNDII